MIVSANLGKATARIYKKISQLRKYGWFSKDVQQMLIKKYGEERKILIEQINELTKERNKLDNQIKQLAKRINKIK